MTRKEPIAACKRRVIGWLRTATPAQLAGVVAVFGDLGAVELVRQVLIVWVDGAHSGPGYTAKVKGGRVVRYRKRGIFRGKSNEKR